MDRPQFEVLYTCAEPSCTAFVPDEHGLCFEHRDLRVCPECHKANGGYEDTIEPTQNYPTTEYLRCCKYCDAMMVASTVPFRYEQIP